MPQIDFFFKMKVALFNKEVLCVRATSLQQPGVRGQWVQLHFSGRQAVFLLGKFRVWSSIVSCALVFLVASLRAHQWESEKPFTETTGSMLVSKDQLSL